LQQFSEGTGLSAKPVIAVTLSGSELPRLVHWRQMFEGLYACGAIPMAVECGASALNVSGLLAHVDGLLISGGGDVDPTLYGGDAQDPAVDGVNVVRDSNEIAAFEFAWRHSIPTLAICRGAQLANAARGGTLYVDLARDHPSGIPHRRTEHELLSVAHPVDVAAGSRLATWLGQDCEFSVNSQHHQGIRRLALGFSATAWADDGLIEAYEASDEPFTAVQWHPEINWSASEMSRRLLRGFVDQCRGVAATIPLVDALPACHPSSS
jgi:putative glutamine amidotransferase